LEAIKIVEKSTLTAKPILSLPKMLTVGLSLSQQVQQLAAMESWHITSQEEP
jgi:hypothetical protein